MNIKSKFLLFLVVPFLLFGHDKCDRPTVKEIVEGFPKFCKFIKTVRTKKVMVGEPVFIDLQVTNLSRHKIDYIWIQKEARKGTFITPGGEIIECGGLGARQTRSFSYKLILLRPGVFHIPASRITQIQKWPLNNNKPIKIPAKAGCSNSVKLEVVPVGISIQQLPAKSKAVVGEEIDIDIEIKNSSKYDLEGFQIRLDYGTDDFVLLKGFPKSSRAIKSGQRIILPYSIMPVSEGSKAIAVRIKKIKFAEKETVFFPTWSLSLSEKTVLDVKPVKVSISMHFQRTEIKLMEKVRSILTVTNESTLNIEGFAHTFQGNFDSFHLLSASRNPGHVLIPPGESRSIEYEYCAEKAGTVKPGMVFLSRLKMNGVWFSDDKKFFASSPCPIIHIAPVKLPGYRKPVTYISRDLKLYLNNFFITTFIILFGLLVLGSLFKLVISSVISEFMYGKIIILSLAGSIAAVLSIFFFTGVYWAWFSILPSLDKVAGLWAGSCFGAFVFGVFRLFRRLNFIYATLLAGTCLSLLSSLLSIGYYCFFHNRFENFPIGITVFLVFAVSLGINAVQFRKI
jgi:hypothetical protein